jgi:hypothetical protein
MMMDAGRPRPPLRESQQQKCAIPPVPPTIAVFIGIARRLCINFARQNLDLRFRRGLDARSIPAVKFRIPDLMQIASRVMEQVNSRNPDAVFAARYANKRAEMERRFDEGLKRLKRWVV